MAEDAESAGADLSPDGRRKDGPAYIRITEDDLEQFGREARQQFAVEAMVKFVVDCEIIGNLIGRRWLLEERSGLKDPYLSSGDLAEADQRSRSRIGSLAFDLLTAQHCVGFDALRREIPTRSLSGASTEVYIVAFLTRRGHRVSFVEPTGEKGADFDTIVDVGDQQVPIEIKTKDDGTAISEQTIINTLSGARSQLPPGGPGIIVLQIPTGWADEPNVGDVIDSTIAQFFRNTRRVNLIIVSWDRFFVSKESDDERFAVARMFRPYTNDHVRTPVPDVERLFGVVTDPI